MSSVEFRSPRQFYLKNGTRSEKVNGRYVANTRYTLDERRSSPPTDRSCGDHLEATSAPELAPVGITTRARNRLYAKLVDELTGPKGELFTSMVEWKSSLGMITSRAVQMRQAYLALRRLEFKKVARILEMPRTRTTKGAIKRATFVGKSSPTSAWLEYWMGWAPLVGDIGHALERLTGTPPESKPFSVGVQFETSTTRTSGTLYSGRLTVSSKRKSRFTAYGKIKVINHNLVLANQLGFVNPALTAWQIVPFSFIVDWFGNVGQVIGSLTDFVGFSFTDTGQAELHEMTASTSYAELRRVYSETGEELGYFPFASQQMGTGSHRSRTPGKLPTPRLNVKMLDRLSLTRAATSVSLLYEIFLRKK